MEIPKKECIQRSFRLKADRRRASGRITRYRCYRCSTNGTISLQMARLVTLPTPLDFVSPSAPLARLHQASQLIDLHAMGVPYTQVTRSILQVLVRFLAV